VGVERAARAGEEDVLVSHANPLGIRFAAFLALSLGPSAMLVAVGCSNLKSSEDRSTLVGSTDGALADAEVEDATLADAEVGDATLADAKAGDATLANAETGHDGGALDAPQASTDGGIEADATIDLLACLGGGSDASPIGSQWAASIAAACGPDLSACFGAAYDAGTVGGPCLEFAACAVSADCTGAAATACGAAASSECQSCLGSLAQCAENACPTLATAFATGLLQPWMIDAAGTAAPEASLDGTSEPHPATADAGACAPAVASGGSVFVVDSTATLFAFDESGTQLASAPLPGSVGDINGGGMTLAMDTVYVTLGSPTNAVVAYSRELGAVSLAQGAFAGLSVPRGIAYGCAAGTFLVGNGAAGISAFSASGSPVNEPDGGFQPYYGPSGVAYDPDDRAFWVANYAGFPSTKWGVSEFSEDGTTVRVFDHTSRFAAPGRHEEPYAVTVCPRAATGGATLVVVGFIDDQSGQGVGAVQIYSTDGIAFGSALGGAYQKPYALSCDSHGRVYIADLTGLYSIDVSGCGRDAGAATPFAGLTPPIYGVVVAE
jgi:hypothetical protein